MKVDLTQEFLSTEITPEKTNELLGQALDKILSPETKIIAIYKRFILRECEKITAPFIGLISYYEKGKENENFDQIVKTFLTYYDVLTTRFSEVIKTNSYNKYTCCLLALSWLEVLENLEKRAQISGDFIARNIATQLQMDINYTIETLYREPSDREKTDG